MTPFLFQVIQYHVDDSPKVHNSDITTQSKIPSFFIKHLANYGKMCLKPLSLVTPFVQSIRAHAL